MDESRIDELLREIGHENISPTPDLVENAIRRIKRVDSIDVIVVAAVILNLVSFIAAALFILFSSYGWIIKITVFTVVSTIMNLCILAAYIVKTQQFPAGNEF